MGLGPGDAGLLAPMAASVLREARAVCGYHTYLDLVEPALLEGKKIIASGMKREMERASAAVDAAVSGLDTVVISSGDAGIYGMAGLILEILDCRELAASVPWQVIPGIPALAAAASLLGAPLMHDFACISLSDLLTDWETISRRVEAAAGADFVIVLYNPRSKRRNWQLSEALETIARHRDPQTPLGLVRNAFRTGQEVLATTLHDFDPERADMLSILIVGNSQTRLLQGPHPAMTTPRGYLAKYGEKC